MKKLELCSFDQTKFNNPDSFYWPGYICFWNDVLTKEEATRQLYDMNAVGAKSLWAIPLPWNFRPNSMKTNFEPEYLSEEYLGLYNEIVQEMQKLDMKLWLYDEAGWPSGGVCGRIVRENPSFARQSLMKQESELDFGNIVQVPDDCLAAFLYKGSTLIKRLKPGEQDNIKEQGMRVETYYAKKEVETEFVPPYPDLLNPEVTEEFIRLTHEAYKKVLGEYFGDTIPLIVTDEAKVDNPPWTDDLDTSFKIEKGYDIKEYLPAIFQNDEEGKEIRIDFFDWWSKRFSEAFFEKIQKWCNKNSLMYIGHLGGEDLTLGSRIYGFGHVLRILRKFDVPGVDAIWKQIHPGKKDNVAINWNDYKVSYPICENHHFPKYASSVAHQGGKTWAWTESFSAYGSALSLEDMKWITDFQFVRGINLLVACEMHYSTKGHYMGSMRPIFCKENPLFRHMELYHGYTARLSYLLSLGKPVIEAAVYFPVRDIWAGGIEAEGVAKSNDTIARLLLENQCDFDMVDDDILEDTSTKAANGYLEAGSMKYKTIYVSKSRHMSSKSKERISEFIRNGVMVLWVDNSGYSEGPEGSTKVEFDSLNGHIEPVIAVKPENKSIRVCKRILGNGNLYFITNEAFSSEKDNGGIHCTVEFKETQPIIEINPETGGCSEPEAASYGNGIWSLKLHLKFAASRIFLFTNDNIPVSTEPATPEKNCRFINEGWSCRKIKAFKLGDEEFEVEENLDDELIPIELGDWRSVLGEDFSGDAEYYTEFEFNKEEAKDALLLDLGKVKGVCEVVMNGKYLGKRAWQPFVFEVKGAVREDRNILKVIVTNTMANQFVTTDKIGRWPDTVIGTYHKQCLAMETGHTESGIYGPVKISSHDK